MVRLAVTALATLALATLGVSAYRPGDEVCRITSDNSCPLDTLTLSKTDGSTLIYPGGKTRCAFDDFKDKSGNFSTNATFFFQVFPKPQKTKLMLYFQGGGACLDDYTCNFAFQCASSQTTFQPNARALSVGVLNGTDENNLFKDYNIVHVPYCTGDIHVGNIVREGKETGIEGIFNKPECLGLNMSIHNNGYENSMAALKWALTNYPNPEHLIISGSSAGSLGAQLLAEAVAKMWKVEENKMRYSVIADSYVGVLPDDKTGGMLVNYHNACDLDLGLSAQAVKDCKNESATVVSMMSTIIEDTLFSDWLFIDSKGDRTQRYFYQMFKDTILAFPFPNLISPEVFYKEMVEMLDAYKNETKRISTFFTDGEMHVFFNKPDWYDTIRSDTTETLGSYIANWLANPGQGSGKGAAGSASGISGGNSTGVPTPASGAASVMTISSALALVVLGVVAL